MSDEEPPSPRCLCRDCCGNDTRPCINAERERDWQLVIEKLNKRIDEQQLLLEGANATCANIAELVGDRGQYRDLVEAVTIKLQTLEAERDNKVATIEGFAGGKWGEEVRVEGRRYLKHLSRDKETGEWKVDKLLRLE